jgi:hypothetical protein
VTDRQLLRFAASFRRGILGRGKSSRAMCFAVAAPLESLLLMCGVEVRLVKGLVGDWEHYWLELGDGRILDPTADQFSMAPVYLGPLPSWYYQPIGGQHENLEANGLEAHR